MVDKKASIGFIDVASGKVRVMIMSVDKNAVFSLDGKGEAETVGYKGGRISDFNGFSTSVNQALEIAEKQAMKNVSDVVISLSDFKYKSYLLSSKIDFPFEKKITLKDIQKCSLNISLENINLEKETLVHIIPMEFVIDDGKVIDNPEGNFAKSLTVHYHIITVDAKMYNDLISVFNSLNLNVKKVVADAYASALSVLVDDDKKVGSLLLNIGKSTMSMAIFIDDKIVYNYSLPLGGDAITNSLSKQINVRFSEAERLKQKYGAGAPLPLDFSDYINLYMIGENGENDPHEVLKSDFLTVSNNITKGIFSILKKCLDDRKVLSYVNRVIVTGGGSKLLGIKDVIADVFNCPVRLAKPIKQKELAENFDDADYATLVGLFLFYKSKFSSDYVKLPSEDGEKSLFSKIMKFWMENFG
ncbi:MAG: cell division protein FtsA [Alphaproteobacteria bacterium]|nr:cell division protein FtsA [Alphaproteobacteria bacterium]